MIVFHHPLLLPSPTRLVARIFNVNQYLHTGLGVRVIVRILGCQPISANRYLPISKTIPITRVRRKERASDREGDWEGGRG